MSPLFQSDWLLERAAALAGSDDFGDPYFREALEVLLRAWDDEAALDSARGWRTWASVVDLLVTRARLTARVKEQPTLTERPVPAPIFIVGLPRTGTTLLHNLLASVSGLRALRLWELRAPVAPRGAGAEWAERQIAQTQKEVGDLYARLPGFEHVHPMDAEAPDECNWLFRHTFTTLVFAILARVPSYARWMVERAPHAAYADYRRQLQILGERTGEARLVLKDPCHLWHLGVLLDTFRDAVVVHVHRDPAETVSSFSSLCHALHTMNTRHADPAATGAYCVDLVDRGLEAMTTARERFPQTRFVDVRYRDLVRDPLGALKRTIAAIGFPLADADGKAASMWLADHPTHGRHDHRPEHFGLRADGLRERYADYARRFGVLEPS